MPRECRRPAHRWPRTGLAVNGSCRNPRFPTTRSDRYRDPAGRRALPRSAPGRNWRTGHWRAASRRARAASCELLLGGAPGSGFLEGRLAIAQYVIDAAHDRGQERERSERHDGPSARLRELLARDDAENEQPLTEGVELAEVARPRLDRPEPQPIGDRAADDDQITRHRRHHEPQRYEAHDGEHHEGGGEEQLVRSRIEHAAEGALPTEALGDEPVKEIRYGGQKET